MANENILKKIEQIISTPKPEVKSGDVLEKVQEAKVENLATEKITEKEKVVIKEKSEKLIVTSTTPVITDEYHVRREKEIDAFLSDGLEETFLAMSPAKQQLFKEEGEKTAKKINILLDATKINLGKIINLIRKWLRQIAGVNRFFLDQEAKIKADRIVKIKNKL